MYVIFYSSFTDVKFRTYEYPKLKHPKLYQLTFEMFTSYTSENLKYDVRNGSSVLNSRHLPDGLQTAEHILAVDWVTWFKLMHGFKVRLKNQSWFRCSRMLMDAGSNIY